MYIQSDIIKSPGVQGKGVQKALKQCIKISFFIKHKKHDITRELGRYHILLYKYIMLHEITF